MNAASKLISEKVSATCLFCAGSFVVRVNPFIMPKANSSGSQYLILLRHPADGPGPTPEQLQAIMQRFGEWMAGLEAKNAVLGTNGLQHAGKILRGPLGETVVTDGPYIEAKEVMGGYVLVTAPSLDAAVAMAKKCPGLDYRMTVEVRPVQQRPGRD